MAARLAAYVAAAGLAAAGGLVLEIAAGRLIAPYVGMSLHTWTAVIAVVLAGFSIGHWLGGLLASAGIGARRGALRLAAAFALAAATAAVSPAMLRLVAPALLADDAGAPWRIVALNAALFLLPSLFVGVVAPLAAALALDDAPAERRGRVLGALYAAGALGGIAGTLLAGYVFIAWIGSIGAVLAVAGAFLAAALGLAAMAGWSGKRLGAAALAALSLAGGGAASGAFASPCMVESDYYCLRLGALGMTPGRDQAVLVLDHLAHSVNDRDDPAWFQHGYLHLVDELTKQRLGRRDGLAALIVGGGGYTLPRAWRLDYPEARLVVAEIDPAVTRFAERHLWFDREGIEIRHADGRVVLQSLPRAATFDVIFVDAVQDITVPAHLVTGEFAAEAALRLKPDGLFAINALDRVGRPAFVLALAKTLAGVFPAVEVWAERGALSAPGRATYIVLAGRGGSPWPGLRARRGERRVWLRWPPAELAEAMASPGLPVLSDNHAPVERLLREGLDLPATGSPR